MNDKFRNSLGRPKQRLQDEQQTSLLGCDCFVIWQLKCNFFLFIYSPIQFSVSGFTHSSWVNTVMSVFWEIDIFTTACVCVGLFHWSLYLDCWKLRLWTALARYAKCVCSITSSSNLNVSVTRCHLWHFQVGFEAIVFSVVLRLVLAVRIPKLASSI